MRHLLTGSLILMAAVALLAAGSGRMALASAGIEPAGYHGDVAEVVVTAGRPAWVMPEVVVRANLMPEVVAHASRVPAPVALSVLPSGLSVN